MLRVSPDIHEARADTPSSRVIRAVWTVLRGEEDAVYMRLHNARLRKVACLMLRCYA